MFSLVDFSHYILATKNRLVTHFGMKHVDAVNMVELHKSFIYSSYQRDLPSDRTARIMVEQLLTSTNQNEVVRENPISPTIRSYLILSAVATLAGLGIYYLTKKPEPQPVVTPIIPAIFTIPQNVQPIGPIGIEPKTISV